MQVKKAFKYELDLNNEQRTACLKHAGAARWAFNFGLRRKKEAYAAGEKTPTDVDLHRELNALKLTEIPWMYEVSKVDTTGSGYYIRVMPSKQIPKSHRSKMVKAYLGGATMKEAAAPFGYSCMACRFALRQAGVTPREQSQAHRRYAVDELFFDEIDSEVKAYWLGFILADGMITTDGNRKPRGVKIGLARRDVGHLRKWRHDCKSDHLIVFREAVVGGTTYQSAVMEISSQYLAARLVECGVVPAKSVVATPCDSVPVELQHHYWRGVFDGDGNISNTDGRWAIGLVGSLTVVTAFRQFLLDVGLPIRGNVRPHRNIWSFRVNGVALPQRVGSLLWKDASVFLDRKYRVFQGMMRTPIQRRDRRSLTAEDLQQLYTEEQSWNAVAFRLGTSCGGLHRIRKRLGLL